MEKVKIKKEKENKTKVVTIRMAPTTHQILSKKAKDKQISLSKLMISAALAVAE
jgi:uncharacterized protein (DUF1778 family)